MNLLLKCLICIVRIDKIDTVEDNTISYNEKIIPIGKSYKENVLKCCKVAAFTISLTHLFTYVHRENLGVYIKTAL